MSYTLAFDSHGRPQANDVRFVVGTRKASPRRRIPAAPVMLAVSFLVAVTALAALGRLEMSWPVLYYGASIVTYVVYARDKTTAQNAGWRVPESTLHLMSLVGGWPGALIAQALLRHKTRKTSFLIGYWLTVILNCVALGLVLLKGVSPLKVLLGAAN